MEPGLKKRSISSVDGLTPEWLIDGRGGRGHIIKTLDHSICMSGCPDLSGVDGGVLLSWKRGVVFMTPLGSALAPHRRHFRKGTSQRSPETSRFWVVAALPSASAKYGTGLAGLFASPGDARRALRWQVFYWRVHQRSLLPVDLPGTAREGEERSLLSNRRSSSRGGLSPLFALPAGMFAWHSGLAGNSEYRLPCLAPDQ